jgi:hypothetical protein
VLGRSLGLVAVVAHKKRHGIFPMLASMFGGCSERQLDDLLGAWLHLVETQVRRVEQEAGAGAWKKFGLGCSCS